MSKEEAAKDIVVAIIGSMGFKCEFSPEEARKLADFYNALVKALA